ncbi:uncharacterized protein LOC124896572 [Capsicum annuum]|uniref:uncharacterized protein LOC124896572 n=1 Tax=Capsicum annuum TaxID=4072 RepID=UPI001FB0A087|nr:uncharacterized protein LOC124896572 [Capsicum annuum]
MYIVSDRHNSILKAAALVYPNVAHCICIYHLWNNIKGRFKKNQKQLKGIFFTMARTYIKADFDRLMKDINKIDNRVKEYLFDIGYEKWSIAHAHVYRSMLMTSNIAESLNSANRDARDLPIKKFLKFMTDLVMRWNNEGRQHSKAIFTELENKYNIILRENHILSDLLLISTLKTLVYSNVHTIYKYICTLLVMGSTHYSYVVIDETGKRNIVCMREKKCSCLQFQVDDIPCPHAMAVLTYMHMDLQSYCVLYYTIENFLKVYELPVIPFPDETVWYIPADMSANIVLPPI